MRTIEAVAATTASRQTVWALLADASAWASWGSWSQVEVEGGGAQGPGTERVLVRRPFRTRERITEWEPSERLGYEVIGGLRVRGYRGAVTLVDAPETGTLIRWCSTYEHAGPLTALMLRVAVRDACKRLAEAASALATSPLRA
jgi:Polyketide cyclase / dehydrase and lipid transport